MAAISEHLPATPLIFAGAFGGPSCVFALTPLRNAVTLAAQDPRSSALTLYRRTFAIGGWTGGSATVVPASVQCVVLGPVFHFYANLVGSNALATVLVGVKETLITYGSQSRNAQLAHNASMPVERQVKPISSFRPWGPGVIFHVLRNVSGMFGMRVMSEPAQDTMRQIYKCFGWGVPSTRLLGDFLACSFSSAVSTIPTLLHYYSVTCPKYAAATPRTRLLLAGSFLRTQYVLVDVGTGKTRPSRLLLRDTFLRAMYGASIWTLFGAVERAAVRWWPG